MTKPLKTHQEVQVEGSTYQQSLLKILDGRTIKDIHGYVTGEFGDDTLVFKMNEIVFDDGTTMSVDGEHEIAYIYGEDFPDGVLKHIYSTDPDNS